MTKPKATRTRRIAVEVLGRIDQGAHSDQQLAQVSNLSEQDARLLREIVLGTVTWRSRLDFQLEAYLKKPVSKQKAAIRNILRSAAYQILFLDRVPAYAVVSESVDLARRYGRGLSGTVNAILRGLAENRKSVDLPDPIKRPARRLATEFSYPEWLVKRWIGRYGYEDARTLCKSGNCRPPITIRVNRKVATCDALVDALRPHQIEAVPLPDLDDFLRIQTPSGLFDTPPFRDGWFSVQGPGAGSVSQLLIVSPGETVLDVCAAPGGKAMAAAERGARLTASDISATRLGVLRENLTRLKLDGNLLACDARSLPFSCTFDHVVVDVPCTGLGTLSRHPEIRWHRQLDDVIRMSHLQTQILNKACLHVRGGRNACLFHLYHRARRERGGCSEIPGRASAVRDRRHRSYRAEAIDQTRSRRNGRSFWSQNPKSREKFLMKSLKVPINQMDMSG